MKFTIEETVKAPRAEVFAAATATEQMQHWMPNLVRVEKITEGPAGVGTRWREKRKMLGKEATEEFEVTAWEPPHRFALSVDGSKGSSGRGEYRFDYRLEEVEGGTRILSDAQIEMPGFFGRMMGRLFTGVIRKACRKDLVALKEHLERKQ